MLKDLAQQNSIVKFNSKSNSKNISLKLLNSFDSKLKDEICLLDKLVQKLDSYVPKR